MKRSIMVILIILALAVALGVYFVMNSTLKKNISTPAPSTASANSIVLKGFAFSPNSLKIKAGQTVTWTNQDSAVHTVISDSGSEISSPSLSNGQTYSHTFSTPGTFPYHCSIHASMKGTVVVE